MREQAREFFRAFLRKMAIIDPVVRVVERWIFFGVVERKERARRRLPESERVLPDERRYYKNGRRAERAKMGRAIAIGVFRVRIDQFGTSLTNFARYFSRNSAARLASIPEPARR